MRPAHAHAAAGNVERAITGVGFWPYENPPEYTLDSTVPDWDLHAANSTAGGSASSGTNVVAIVVPTVLGCLALAALVAGLVIYRRRRLAATASSAASAAESGKVAWASVGDSTSGGGSGGGGRSMLERRLSSVSRHGAPSSRSVLAGASHLGHNSSLAGGPPPLSKQPFACGAWVARDGWLLGQACGRRLRPPPSSSLATPPRPPLRPAPRRLLAH